eukprot:Hpha_TRINITY_DN16022_c3_g1::TRINITY_DN16022_c3_g1_i1::g.118659::m.118659
MSEGHSAPGLWLLKSSAQGRELPGLKSLLFIGVEQEYQHVTTAKHHDASPSPEQPDRGFAQPPVNRPSNRPSKSQEGPRAYGGPTKPKRGMVEAYGSRGGPRVSGVHLSGGKSPNRRSTSRSKVSRSRSASPTSRQSQTRTPGTSPGTRQPPRRFGSPPRFGATPPRRSYVPPPDLGTGTHQPSPRKLGPGEEARMRLMRHSATRNQVPVQYERLLSNQQIRPQGVNNGARSVADRLQQAEKEQPTNGTFATLPSPDQEPGPRKLTRPFEVRTLSSYKKKNFDRAPSEPEVPTRALKVCVDAFPSALRVPTLTEATTSALAEHGFTAANTGFVYSSCAREGDVTLKELEATWGAGSRLGGHAGIAFGGKAAWEDAAEKAREEGKQRVLVYLGTQATAQDGKKTVSCPGLRNWRQKMPNLNLDQWDVEQAVVSQLLHPHTDTIPDDEHEGLELAYTNFEVAVEYLRHVLSGLSWCEAIAFVGGINVSVQGFEPRFVPLILEAETTEGGHVVDYYSTAFEHYDDQRAWEWRSRHSVKRILKSSNAEPPSPSGSAPGEDRAWEGKAGVFFPVTEEAADICDAEPTGELEQCLKHFPTAQRNKVVDEAVARTLAARGYLQKNTLLAHATCPDEVNYDDDADLVPLMHRRWGEKFTLGGLAGMPFCGQTGWGAFAAHLPRDGRILLVFAPHTGVNADGEVGKLRRDGQDQDSTCCGAAIAAWKAGGGTGEIRRYDTQQSTLSSLLTPYINAINQYECPERGLVYANFDVVADYLRAIMKVPANCKEIAVVGGLMLNLPTPFEDRFVPLVFEVLDCESGNVTDLFPEAFPHLTADPWRAANPAGQPKTLPLDSRRPCRTAEDPAAPSLPAAKPSTDRRKSCVPTVAQTWQSRDGRFFPLTHTKEEEELVSREEGELTHCLRHFPSALVASKIDACVDSALTTRGWSKSNTVLVASACPEEINWHDPESSIIPVLSRRCRSQVLIGGAAGFATGGVYMWKQMLQSLRPGTNVLIVLSTHTGVSPNGELGRVRSAPDRARALAGSPRWKKGGAYVSCSHAIAAGDGEGHDDPEWNPEQTLVNKEINKALEGKEERTGKTLVEANYRAARKFFQSVLKAGGKEGCQEIAILGGITANLPEPFEDRLDPLEFELLSSSGEVVDLMGSFSRGEASTAVSGRFFDVFA